MDSRKLSSERKLLQTFFLADWQGSSFPAGTQRPEDVPLWPYFGRDVPDHSRTKTGRIRFLAYFGSALSDMHLASENIKIFP